MREKSTAGQNTTRQLIVYREMNVGVVPNRFRWTGTHLGIWNNYYAATNAMSRTVVDMRRNCWIIAPGFDKGYLAHDRGRPHAIEKRGQHAA